MSLVKSRLQENVVYQNCLYAIYDNKLLILTINSDELEMDGADITFEVEIIYEGF